MHIVHSYDLPKLFLLNQGTALQIRGCIVLGIGGVLEDRAPYTSHT